MLLCVGIVQSVRCCLQGNRCCNGKDCSGRELVCSSGSKTCVKKPPPPPTCKSKECCGDIDCPSGTWCIKPNYVCAPKCGMEVRVHSSCPFVPGLA